MWNRDRSTGLSVAVCFVVVAILTVGLFCGPAVARWWFEVYRGWSAESDGMRRMMTLFCACFYPCAGFAYMTLYSLIRLLRNIKRGDVFIQANVRYLRRISWCCFAVAGITLVGGCIYIPFLFVAVAAAFVGLMLRVVKNLMQNAVEIQAENELTI